LLVRGLAAQRKKSKPDYRKAHLMNRPSALPRTPPRPAGWRSDLRLRFWRYLPLKFIGISAFMWVFFLGYFQTLRHPVYPVFQMPLTALDQLIPFQPHAMLAYVSLWVYVGIAPGLLLTWKELIVYGLWAAVLCITGLLIFHFWPTAVPPHGVDRSGYPGFGLLQGVDAAGNACPSLHVATAVFTAIWVERLLRIIGVPRSLRLLNLLWVLAIAHSTVATRQHVVLDAVAGAALGALFAALAILCCPWLGRSEGR
jgi:PAP2 superfamily